MSKSALSLIGVLAALGLSACGHTWAPGPGVSLDQFDATKARCSLIARNNGGSFAAYGDPSFVAGAALGNAIGTSIRTTRDFDDCMLMAGWRIVDGAPAGGSSVSHTDAGASEKDEFPRTAFNQNHSLQIILPPGWLQSTPPQPASEISIFAKYSHADAALVVRTSPSSDVVDLQTYSEGIRKNQVSRLNDTNSSSIYKIDLNGKTAFRYDVSFTSNGARIHSLITIVIIGNDVVRLSCFAIESKFPELRPDFERIARSLSENHAV